MSKITLGRRILYILLVVLAYGVHRVHKFQAKCEREDFMRRHGMICQQGNAAQRFTDFVKSNSRFSDIAQDVRNPPLATPGLRKEALSREQSMFSNALFKVCTGMDREVVYQEFLSEANGVKDNPEVARQLKSVLWVAADCSVAHTNFLQQLSAAKGQYINVMFDEAGSWSFPDTPSEIMTNALNAINCYKREKENFLSVVTVGTNTLAGTLGETSAAGKMYIDILLHCAKEWPASRFCDTWLDEASLLAEVGQALSSSEKWQMVNGVPVCEDISLYKSLLRMSDRSDMTWNKTIALYNELPQIIVEGGLEREEHATRQAFESANEKNPKSIFGIHLGSICRVHKRNEFARGVVVIDKVYYEQEIMSDIRHGRLKVRLPLRFHSINSVELHVDKLLHRIYQIEGEGHFVNEKELSKILEQIEDKYCIVMTPLDVATAKKIVTGAQCRRWEYKSRKHGKMLELEYFGSSGRVVIRLKDLELSKHSKESEERLEDMLNKAAL